MTESASFALISTTVWVVSTVAVLAQTLQSVPLYASGRLFTSFVVMM